MSSDPNDRPQQSVSQPEQNDAASPVPPNDPSTVAQSSAKEDQSEKTAKAGKRILIGSQRDPHAYRPKPKRDWTPVERESKNKAKDKASSAQPADDRPEQTRPSSGEGSEPATSAPSAPDAPVAEASGPAEPTPPAQPPKTEQRTPSLAESTDALPPGPPTTGDQASAPAAAEGRATEPSRPEPQSAQGPAEAAPHANEPVAQASRPAEADVSDVALGADFPPTNLRRQLSPELEKELEESLGDASLDDLLSEDDLAGSAEPLEAESRCSGRVVAIHREDVFVDLGRREQGTVPLRQLAEPPEVGQMLDVIVTRFNAAEGLYELMVPHAAADVGDWSDLEEGMTVEARVTGHNSGGLECEVNHIRGFIPVSQIALYRVENLEEFVGEKFPCVVTEANPQRRNLVLSRRAVLEREREESRVNLLESLEPGEIREGVVRKILDFGAFVDIGGVDGLLHISQLGWGRVAHPSDVLSEGQRIKVKVEKIDRATGKIGLGYRDMLENPWDNAAQKYPPNSVAKGTVSKLMEFGAFVQLESGVEGLIHISELSHKRVWRVSDVVNEGDEVEVVVLSVDEDAQRIGLSLKDLQPDPRAQKKDQTEDEPASEAEPLPKKLRNKPSKPLKGGVGRSTGGDKFGLKW